MIAHGVPNHKKMFLLRNVIITIIPNMFNPNIFYKKIIINYNFTFDFINFKQNENI